MQKTRMCDECSYIHLPQPKCPYCGHDYKKKESKTKSKNKNHENKII